MSYIDAYDTHEYYDEATDEYKTLKQSQPRYFRFDIGDNSGVIDSDGKVIIPAIYFNVHIVNDKLFQVEVTGSGERLLYDTHGRYVGKISRSESKKWYQLLHMSKKKQPRRAALK